MENRFRRVPLIGWKKKSLNVETLPSKRDVLSVFLYLMQDEGKNAKECASILLKSVTSVYEKFQIPVKRSDKIKSLILLNYNKYKQIKKLRTCADKKKFTNILEELFDVSDANAIKILRKQKNQKAIDFLTEHRESVAVARLKLFLDSDEVSEENVSTNDFSEEQCSAMYFSDEDGSVMELPCDDNKPTFHAQKSKKRKLANPKRKTIVDEALTQVLDRYKISNIAAAAIISQTAYNLGHDVESLNVSAEHIRTQRHGNRELIYKKVKDEFTANATYTVHWDGKVLEDCTSEDQKSSNRLAIILSSNGNSKVLGIPKISRQTGPIEGAAVYSALVDWGVQNHVRAMCFDTTASNTSTSIGACATIEQNVGKQLLHLACRHHISELLAGAAFKISVEKTTTGPKMTLFENFRNAWPQMRQGEYEYGIEDADVAKVFTNDIRSALITFINDQIKNKVDSTRHDYIEMQKLCSLFIGQPIPGYKISQPGAVSHARWMAKIIYCLKIFLFRKQFAISSKTLRNIRRFNIIVLRVYMKYWFLCQLAPKAPDNDLGLLKELENYKLIDTDIAISVQSKLRGHLWYLSESNIALAFFDDEVSVDMKRKMLSNLKRNGNPDNPKRINLPLEVLTSSELCDFVTSNTYSFFDNILDKNITSISNDYLETDPSTWDQCENYILAKTIVSKLLVVNDIAERGIALITRFNEALTHQEEQKQFLLHAVEQHYKKLPSRNTSKAKFIEYLNKKLPKKKCLK